MTKKAYDGYEYKLVEKPGTNFDPRFKPELTPKEMLEMGVFEGKYISDCKGEFPASWYKSAKLSAEPDVSINYFGIKSRMPLKHWNKKGWIYGPDKRGWFQWYCRYYMGRRIPDVDKKQISRWRSFKRHRGAIHADEKRKSITTLEEKKTHRPKQRQALLQWAYDPFG